MNYHVPRNPRLLLKEAGFKSNLLRQGKNLLQYGKNLAKNPVKQLGKNLKSGGTAIDAEKRFDVLENALEGALDKGKQVRFSALEKADPNRGMLGKGVDWLRGQGILAAGRSTRGTINKSQQASLKKYMDKRGLLHTTKDGRKVIHRDAKVEDLQKAYDRVQGYKTTGKAGVIDKIRGAGNYMPLPGERGLFLGGAALGMGGQMANKETKDGRKRSLGERLARAGTIGLAETVAAPIGVSNRLFGGAGMLAEQGVVLGAEAALNRNNKANVGGHYIQSPQQRQQYNRNRVTQPQVKQASYIHKNPRRVLRSIVK